MGKILKFLELFLWIGLLLVGIFVQYFASFQSAIFESIVYWWALIVWVFVIWKFKIQANISLAISLIILCIGILIKILGFLEIGEKIARLSIIGWILGFIQTLKEYHKKS